MNLIQISYIRITIKVTFDTLHNYDGKLYNANETKYLYYCIRIYLLIISFNFKYLSITHTVRQANMIEPTDRNTKKKQIKSSIHRGDVNVT